MKEEYITINPDGQIRVKTVTSVDVDGELISANHSRVIVPGDDVSTESARLQQVVSTFHTEKVVADFKRTRVEAQKELDARQLEARQRASHQSALG